MMNPEVQSLLALLTKKFEKGAWHGPTVKETLEGLSSADAFNRLPNTHSIIELVAHMAVWRNYVTNKLKGDLTYKVTEAQNFPESRNWEETLTDLERSQADLLAAIESHAPTDLTAQVPWTTDPLTYYTLLHGVIHHDLYHIGQINLIKKATVAQPL